MNVVELLEALGKTDVVTWRCKADDRLAKLGGRTSERLLILRFQREDDGAWTPSEEPWAVEDFLKAFEPVR